MLIISYYSSVFIHIFNFRKAMFYLTTTATIAATIATTASKRVDCLTLNYREVDVKNEYG